MKTADARQGPRLASFVGRGSTGRPAGGVFFRPIWWRRARFSNSRAERERKIEDRIARSVAREMSIRGE